MPQLVCLHEYVPLRAKTSQKKPGSRIPGLGTSMRPSIRLVWLLMFCMLVVMALMTQASSASAAVPTVTAITPNNGPEAGATSVAITGTGFIAGSTVNFGSNAATDAIVNSSTSITATSPEGTGTVEVSVTNANGTSASTPYAQFGYDSPPNGLWLGLNGNAGGAYVGSIGDFTEHNIVYDREEYTAGEIPKNEDHLEKAVKAGMIPITVIEYAGYTGKFKPDYEFPTEANGKLSTYVKGFVTTANSILKLYPGRPLFFEPMNEPWGYTTPQFNGAQYASVIAKLLPEAQMAGIPLSDIYIAAFGSDCTKAECGGNHEGCEKEGHEECTSNGWVPAMYAAQPKLKTEIQGWYFHPYGSPKGTGRGYSAGMESLPFVQAKMTSGQNNIIVSEVGYCALGCEQKRALQWQSAGRK